jgi:hypothetical protein
MLISDRNRTSFRFVLTFWLTLSLAIAAWPWPRQTVARHKSTPVQTLQKSKPSQETEPNALKAYGQLGVSFEENRGQVDQGVRFLARHGGATVFLTNDAATFVLAAREQTGASKSESSETLSGEKANRDEGTTDPITRLGQAQATKDRLRLHTIRMTFAGANPWAEVTGERELEGKVNYFRGSDPAKWQTNVPTYGAVRYRGIYEGVDLVYYGNERGEMEYDFQVAPGADASQISFRVEGAESLEVDPLGDLVITTPAGEMRQHKPAVYQEAAGTRQIIESSFTVEADGLVRFALGEYNKSAPLIIDPVLTYSTYLGGSGGDTGLGITVDSSGSAYVTGRTLSTNLPRANALQNTLSGGLDVFVTKLHPSGSALVYSTYLGGGADDGGNDIAVDAAGNAYVTGFTDSTNFPTANAIRSTFGGGSDDAFLTKINPAGSALVYSTYLGGSSGDSGYSIAVNSGNAYVTGTTFSSNFPTANPLQGTIRATQDAFVTRVNAAGSALVYSTFLGGTGGEAAYGIAVDSTGSAYLAGATFSPNFPTANPFQSTVKGATDGFVTKLNAAGSALVYSTYLGGNVDEIASDIALDSSGNAYVTGSTTSANFPTASALQNANGGSVDAFVTKFNAAGTSLLYSTYLGGNAADYGIGVALDSSGNASIAGETNSSNFPIANAVQTAYGGNRDAFVMKLNAAGAALIYSTYLGKSGGDAANALAGDSAGNAYVTGFTVSTNFPTANPFQPTFGGGTDDAFVAKIGEASWEPAVLTAGQVELKSWTFQGRNYAYVKLLFPNAGYRVVNWGQAVRAGNAFTVDAAVERFTGPSVQALTTTAQIYDLGVLANGTYSFNFRTSGTLANTMQFTITSTAPPANPIDNQREFVRQQYRDFLNREPDQAGENFWTDNILKCNDPDRRPPGQTAAQCRLRQRETTSAAFYLSPEFQYTGYYVFRMFVGGLGREPKLSEFTPDALFVGNGIIVNGELSAAKINQNKADFAAQFANCTDAAKYRCAEFKAIYDSLTNPQYVDKLFQNTGVSRTAAERTALIDALNGGTQTRAQVLQKVVDGINVIAEGNQQFTTTYGHAFYDQQFNRAFVQLEYFGYMRRDPDEAGYAFWLAKLNDFGGDFVKAEMVLAFITSPEYRARFGAP